MHVRRPGIVLRRAGLHVRGPSMDVVGSGVDVVMFRRSCRSRQQLGHEECTCAGPA